MERTPTIKTSEHAHRKFRQQRLGVMNINIQIKCNRRNKIQNESMNGFTVIRQAKGHFEPNPFLSVSLVKVPMTQEHCNKLMERFFLRIIKDPTRVLVDGPIALTFDTRVPQGRKRKFQKIERTYFFKIGETRRIFYNLMQMAKRIKWSQFKYKDIQTGSSEKYPKKEKKKKIFQRDLEAKFERIYVSPVDICETDC